MKKLSIKFAAVFLSICLLSAGTIPVQAANYPEGFTEITGNPPTTYLVGEAFRAGDVGLNVYSKTGTPTTYKDNLEFSANGIPITDGYKLKEVGQLTITVKRNDKQAEYQVRVTPALKGKIKECTVITLPSKRTYRQYTEPFDPKGTEVKCTFADGTTKNLGYKDLEFYVVDRNMTDSKDRTPMKDGYIFEEAGNRTLIIRVLDYEMSIPIGIRPYFDEHIKDIDVLTEPKTLTYKVGDSLKREELSFRINFKDGTTSDLAHDRLAFIVDGYYITGPYSFTEVGKKDITVRWGLYEYNFTVNVIKASAPAPASSTPASSGKPSSSSGKPSSSSSQSAGVTVKDVEMRSEPKTFTYNVGDTFKAEEISMRLILSDGTTKTVTHDKLKFTANGTSINSNYKFRDAGEKKVVVTWRDYEYEFTINVKNSSSSSKVTVKDVELLTEPQTTTYKVGGSPFKAEEISLRVTYSDGTTKDITHDKLKITANENKIDSNYVFKEAGKKKILVTWGDYDYRYTVNVTAAEGGSESTAGKTVKDVELLTEPQTFTYKVGGSPFKAAEISLRVTYSDGTTKDITHDKLKITANGNKINSQYKFKEAGTKKMVVSWGDYEYRYEIKVVK